MSDKNYVIGKHGSDTMWLDAEVMAWVGNLFKATRFTQNDAVLVVQKLEAETGERAYTEPIITAARRGLEVCGGKEED